MGIHPREVTMSFQALASRRRGFLASLAAGAGTVATGLWSRAEAEVPFVNKPSALRVSGRLAYSFPKFSFLPPERRNCFMEMWKNCRKRRDVHNPRGRNMPEPSDGSGNPRLPQHPLVEQRKPDPNQPAKRVLELVGLPGNSDRSGFQRLYLSTKLDYYAEFLDSDIVSTEAVPTADSPIHGYEATRVSIGRDATIHYVRVRSPQPVDEFDLDVRLGAPAAAAAPAFISPINGCTDTCHTACGTCGGTCRTCAYDLTCAATCPATCAATCPNTCPNTCQGATCATCPGHGTCVATQCVAGPNDLQNPCVYTNNQGNTCNTCAATCQTCFTACNQATCAHTQCQQATCNTCAQALTCALTCP